MDLHQLADRLDPVRNRLEVLDRLETLFTRGQIPDPWPSGELDGRVLATWTWGPWDAFVSRVAAFWMPWLGKTFDAAARTGINRFTASPGTRVSLGLLFPSHPQRLAGGHLEAFPFENRIGRGEVDPEVEVLKIDYDSGSNPGPVRRILDELVEIEPGCYLGKVLLRAGGRHRRIGFFFLEA